MAAPERAKPADELPFDWKVALASLAGASAVIVGGVTWLSARRTAAKLLEEEAEGGGSKRRAAAATATTAPATTASMAAAAAAPRGAHPTLHDIAATPLPRGGTAGSLAARALLYGTALCLAGGAVGAAATAWWLGVGSLSEFALRMREPEYMPRFRAWLEGGLAPGLGAVTGGGRALARAADASVGSAIRAAAPEVKGQALEEELAMLSKRERRQVEEVLQMFDEPPPPPPAAAPPLK
jgi:hypothetical protein